MVRAAARLVAAGEVRRPDRIDALGPWHIWTSDSVRADRLDFRPRHRLAVLVVQALPAARRCGCRVDRRTAGAGAGWNCPSRTSSARPPGRSASCSRSPARCATWSADRPPSCLLPYRHHDRQERYMRVTDGDSGTAADDLVSAQPAAGGATTGRELGSAISTLSESVSRSTITDDL